MSGRDDTIRHPRVVAVEATNLRESGEGAKTAGEGSNDRRGPGELHK